MTQFVVKITCELAARLGYVKRGWIPVVWDDVTWNYDNLFSIPELTTVYPCRAAMLLKLSNDRGRGNGVSRRLKIFLLTHALLDVMFSQNDTMLVHSLHNFIEIGWNVEIWRFFSRVFRRRGRLIIRRIIIQNESPH
ncbi:hypothetical protein [Rothia dentocariosa]|uniref:hypothetical protein n=1 Tax=Rothia dentocariosa TaxID=2047 RepID=UPI0028EDF1B9|nr:hypothetical protein [Rothia dentocariosa]